MVAGRSRDELCHESFVAAHLSPQLALLAIADDRSRCDPVHQLPLLLLIHASLGFQRALDLRVWCSNEEDASSEIEGCVSLIIVV